MKQKKHFSSKVRYEVGRRDDENLFGLTNSKPRSVKNGGKLNQSNMTGRSKRSRQRQRGLRKNSSIFRESFYTLIKLSTKLIDVNWDKTILKTCILLSDDSNLSGDQTSEEAI